MSINVISVLSPTREVGGLLVFLEAVVDFLILRKVDNDRGSIGTDHTIFWMGLLVDDDRESPHGEEEDSEMEHLVPDDLDDEPDMV